jgi:hypothetical protein
VCKWLLDSSSRGNTPETDKLQKKSRSTRSRRGTGASCPRHGAASWAIVNCQTSTNMSDPTAALREAVDALELEHLDYLLSGLEADAVSSPTPVFTVVGSEVNIDWYLETGNEIVTFSEADQRVLRHAWLEGHDPKVPAKVLTIFRLGN